MTAVPSPRYHVENIPNELKDQSRWCVFQVVPGANGKAKKVPLIAGMRPIPGIRVHAACNDPATWRSFDEALADAEARGLFLGFVFDRNIGMTFVDLDDAMGAAGTLTPDAQRIVEALDSYTEVSVSGNGLHVVARGLPPERFTPNGFAGRVEIFPRRGGRFMVVTGNTRPALGSRDGRIEERSAEIARLFPARPDNGSHHTGPHASHEAIAQLSEADEDAIVAWATPYWTEGRRHYIALFLSGYLAKQGIAREQAVAIIECLAIDDEDPAARTNAAHDTYDRWEAGEDVSGYQGLLDICGLAAEDLAPLDAVVNAFWQVTHAPGGAHQSSGRITLGQSRDARSVATEPKWPTLDPAALHGLAGEVVHTIEPHTEGDSIAVLINFLTMFGSALNRGPYAPVGATRHHANLFAVVVGDSARGRKGTAYSEPRRLMQLADLEWAENRIISGLSSGEGLIAQVRDEVVKISRKGEEELVDPGEPDKRLLVVEEEFASVLHVIERDGNTLSPVARGAWDGQDLRTLTKNAPLRATKPHIAILGHITQDELLRNLHATERVNGFANRFLILLVRRSKSLPHGGFLSDAEITALARRIEIALHEARKRGEMRRDTAANQMWEAVYPELTRERPGMLAAITARAEAQVLRLSIYALIDGAMAIRPAHLEAALALWTYSEESAAYIFGDAIGDLVADTILRALRTNGAMTQTQLSELFGRNQNAARLQRALVLLLTLGKVRTWPGESVNGGRAPTWWGATS